MPQLRPISESRGGKGDGTRGSGVLGSLADPTRMSLYEFVARSTEAVGRDEAAAAVGIPRQTAAYHLDRLAADGLVEVDFVRRTGRTGPGAGRPAKLYRRSNQELEITVPPRRYLLAARVFLEAVAGADPRGGGRSGLADSARRIGVSLGRAGLTTALEEAGYAPEVSSENEIKFLNCPFHALAETDREITCGMNLELVKGIIEGAGDTASAHLEPEPGYCCVRIRATPD
jgi:predicted ArsR family transcriptional regulator